MDTEKTPINILPNEISMEDRLRWRLASESANRAAAELRAAKAELANLESQVSLKYRIGATDTADMDTGVITRK